MGKVTRSKRHSGSRRMSKGCTGKLPLGVTLAAGIVMAVLIETIMASEVSILPSSRTAGGSLSF